MSAQPLPQRRGLLAAVAAQVLSFLLEPVEETIAPEPVELVPQPVIAFVPAAPKAGTTTVARLLAAELGMRADGAAAVWTPASAPSRGPVPPSRAASRLAMALHGVGDGAQPPVGAHAPRAVGRVCLAAGSDPAALVAAARYLAPVVLDLPADGSALAAARAADRVVVVAGAAHEPALAAAVASLVGGEPLRVVNRIAARGDWDGRADSYFPEARLAARAALSGARAFGALGAAVAALADELGAVASFASRTAALAGARKAPASLTRSREAGA